MCLAIPGKIIKIEGQKATIEYPTQTNQALIGGEKVKVGDFVMVQMGIIIKKINKGEVKLILQAWKG